MSDYVVNTLVDLNNALAAVNPGDNILLRGGIYYPTSRINFSRAGAQGIPITLKSYPGEWAVFDGSKGFVSPGWEPPMLHIHAPYYILADFEVRNNKIGRGIYSNQGELIFDNIIAHHNAGSGFYHTDGYHCQWLNCVGHNNQDPLGTGQEDTSNGGNADGFSLESGGTHIVRGCLAYDNSDDGFDTWESVENLIEDCISHNNGRYDGNGNGFKLGHGDHDTHIANNICRRCFSDFNKKPIALAGGRGFTMNGGSGNLVEFCTSYMNDEYEFLNTENKPNTIRNSIAVGAPNALNGAIHDHNNWNLGITDPKFVSTDPGSPDFMKLREDSPCRGVASDGSDIGAYQYEGGGEPGLPSFGPGQSAIATIPTTVKPDSLACDLELFIGPDPNTKLATSGKTRFTSTGVQQNVVAPIIMPTLAGTFHVYIDLWYGEHSIGSFVSTQDINIIEGIIGPIIWS